MESVLNKQVLDGKKINNMVVTILIIIGAFLVPTFLAKIVPLGQYQQIVVGTIVNMSLILAALFTKGTVKTLAIAILPSVSTILSGLLFGGMTLYTKTMIPVIWLGNFVFIYLYKLLFLNKNFNYIITAAVSIILKVAIIYAGFNIMVNVLEVPDMARQTLNIAMGMTQLITATTGSIIAFLVLNVTTKRMNKN